MTQLVDRDLGQLQQAQPVVEWSESPSSIRVCAVCKLGHKARQQQFVQEMVARWLVAGRSLPIISATSEVTDARHFMTVEVEVERPGDWNRIRKNLSHLCREIRLGLASPAYARFIRDGRSPFGGLKPLLMHEMLVALVERCPNDFETDLFEEAQRFSLASGERFRSLRSVRHLCRIVCSHYLFRRRVRAKVGRNSQKRHLLLKLLPVRLRYQFGLKSVVGVTIGVNFVSEHELFGEAHILRAVQRLMPRVVGVRDSFVVQKDREDSIFTLYLEIEKEGGDAFTLSERRRLTAELPTELKESIERLSHPVFVRRNEEELMRRVVALSRELRYVRDLPQVSISFVEQTPRTLVFNIVLLRLLGRSDPPLADLIRNQPSGVQLIVQEQKIVGHLRQKYSKEANVFCLEFDKEPFLRRDYSIDLYKARQYVVSMLTRVFGEIRDYNGGLILKQDELLTAAKALLQERGTHQEYLLENLFHALTPAAMQSCLQPTVLGRLFALFLELLESEDEVYGMRTAHLDDCSLVMLRAEEENYQERVEQEVARFGVEPMLLARVSLSVHGAYYLGYVRLRCEAREGAGFAALISSAMTDWTRQLRTRQVLRINLPRYIASLDPRIGADRRSGVLIKMLYEGLTRIGKDGKPELAAAGRVTLSPDQKSYTFELRETTWSNGAPLTAYDFEYAWKKALDPQFFHRWSYLFHPIRNARRAKLGEVSIDEVGVRALSDRTLLVELEHPTPYLLDLMAHWSYSPLSHEMERDRPDWAHLPGERFVCNGPFRLAEIKRGQELRLVKNRRYWDADSVCLDYIDVHSITDPSQVSQMFEKGELDLLGEPLCILPKEAIDSIGTESKSVTTASSGVFWFWFNVEHGILASKKVRQALCYAIDRQAVIDRVGVHASRPAYGPLPKSLALGSESPIEDAAPELARVLFEEGLAELGMSCEEGLVITCRDDDPEIEATRVVMEQWRQALGLETEIRLVPTHKYVDHLLSQEIQMAAITWYTWFGDPIYNLEHLKYPERNLNPTRWHHPKYVSLLDASDHCLDKWERRDHLRAAERILMEEMPIAPVFQAAYCYLTQKDLHEVHLTDLGQIDFKTAYVGEEEKR